MYCERCYYIKNGHYNLEFEDEYEKCPKCGYESEKNSFCDECFNIIENKEDEVRIKMMKTLCKKCANKYDAYFNSYQKNSFLVKWMKLNNDVEILESSENKPFKYYSYLKVNNIIIMTELGTLIKYLRKEIDKIKFIDKSLDRRGLSDDMELLYNENIERDKFESIDLDTLVFSDESTVNEAIDKLVENATIYNDKFKNYLNSIKKPDWYINKIRAKILELTVFGRLNSCKNEVSSIKLSNGFTKVKINSSSYDSYNDEWNIKYNTLVFNEKGDKVPYNSYKKDKNNEITIEDSLFIKYFIMKSIINPFKHYAVKKDNND